MNPGDDDDILAGELALGLLEGAERDDAEARAGNDAEFAALVEAWRNRLAPLLTQHSEAPPERLWQGIKARLSANDDAPLNDAERALRRWRMLGISASAIAASLALVLVTRAPEPPPQVQTQPQGLPAPCLSPLCKAMEAPPSSRSAPIPTDGCSSRRSACPPTAACPSFGSSPKTESPVRSA
jgi:hypothetical protein